MVHNCQTWHKANENRFNNRLNHTSFLSFHEDDFTIALWSVQDLTLDPWVCPTVVSVLRGHSRGVTCLAFSPDGTQLLSGGKDKVGCLLTGLDSGILGTPEPSRTFCITLFEPLPYRDPGRLFQALILWDVGSSRPALSKSLLHAHKDWISGCAWATGRLVGPPFKNMNCEMSLVFQLPLCLM